MGVQDPELDALLEFLKSSRGFDFSGYKRSTLQRRITRRMSEVGVEDYGAYQDHLELDPHEFVELFNSILINVTGFFRDRAAWDHLAGHVVPDLLQKVPAEQSLRVWSAACASGEEAYTMAIVLAEALGIEECLQRVKIYATDIDEDALTTARRATYSRDRLKDMPDDLVARYFEHDARGFAFRPDLRRTVIFGRNNLVADAPITRVDILVSRNALMYFTAEAQERILRHFHFALRPTGYLFLGKSEMLVSHPDLFRPQSLRWRVFTKVANGRSRERFVFIPEDRERDGGKLALADSARLGEHAYDAAPVAQVVIDRDGFLRAANHRARALFGLSAHDEGRPLADLELSYRPVELRSAIQRVYASRTTQRLGRAEAVGEGGRTLHLEVDAVPLISDDTLLGCGVVFRDVTELSELDAEHRRAKRELEVAYEELQSTVEELETTNEELQSTNEELETTNEELQSSNEELETMNEELQSTNDELETMNTEQSTRARDLDRTNTILDGIVGAMGVGVAVVDAEQCVRLWNTEARDLWGLRADEAEGRHLLSLDIGLPVHELREPVRAALASDPESASVELAALDRRGRRFTCPVRVLPLRSSGGDAYGAILLMRDSVGLDGPIVTE